MTAPFTDQMKRTLFNLAAGFSSALLLFVLLLWLRSSDGDDLTYYGPPEYLEIISSDGLLRVGYGHMTTSGNRPRPGWNASFWPFTDQRRHNSTDLTNNTTFGFQYERWLAYRTKVFAQAHSITLPYWFLALLTAALPISAVAIHRRRKQAQMRQQRGLCPKCGYDLRASPDRCPECGTPALTKEK